MSVTASEDIAGFQRLTAYVKSNGSLYNDMPLAWQDTWEGIYKLGAENKTASELHGLDRNLLIELHAESGLREQADEWLTHSLNRIKALRPKHILELGCGAGQFVFNLACHTQSYKATDYAFSAIKNLKEKIVADPVKWHNVKAWVADANAFDGIEDRSLDLVLMHSVVQYFPDSIYLLSVIENSVNKLESGGCIFIGDMQAKGSLRMHHSSEQLKRSAKDMSLKKYRESIQHRIDIEDELVIDPAFFYFLTERIPAIKGVDVQMRQGSYNNEITKYHYDVWLYVHEAPEVAATDIVVEWLEHNSILWLKAKLTKNPGKVFQVVGIPDSRTIQDYALQQLADSLDESFTVVELENKLHKQHYAIDPGEFWRLGQELNYSTHVRWTSDGSDSRYEVVFVPIGTYKKLPEPPSAITSEMQASDFIKEPFRKKLSVPVLTIESWKENLKRFLPAYMIPAEFVIVDAFPLTPNGKIDHKLLPKPDGERRIKEPVNRANTTEEKLLSAIWIDVLGLDSVSITDNFFELGGHSMIALQMITRLEKQTGIRLTFSVLLENPTIHKLAAALSAGNVSGKWRSLVAIKPSGMKDPLYMVHGAGSGALNFGSLARFMDPNQPVYGLQAIGIDGNEKPLNRIEDMAAFYISEIIEHNPSGPYAIAGYSFGGIIAFEIAKQLTAMGRQVKKLAIFDSYAYQSDSFKPAYVRCWNRFKETVMNTGFKFYFFMKDPGLIAKYKIGTIRRNWTQLAEKMNTSKSEDDVFKHIAGKIDAANNIAYANYRLTPYDGNIDIFRSEKKIYYMPDFKYLGWKPFALKGVDVHDIPGDHFDMFASPNNAGVAKILQQVLDKS